MVELKKRISSKDESAVPIINSKMVVVGESYPNVYKSNCPIHGKSQNFIGGYNQGGHDYIGVCLQCCYEIYQHLKKSDNLIIINETLNSSDFFKRYLDSTT